MSDNRVRRESWSIAGKLLNCSRAKLLQRAKRLRTDTGYYFFKTNYRCAIKFLLLYDDAKPQKVTLISRVVT